MALTTTPANTDERTQVGPLLAHLCKTPEKLYADKGYDASWLRFYLQKNYQIEPCIPKRQRRNSKKSKVITQNHRWVVERTFAWYQRKFRRINIKWERKASPWKGFLAAAFIFYWIQQLVG